MILTLLLEGDGLALLLVLRFSYESLPEALIFMI